VSRRESLHLKMEMLRMRGAIERGEIVAAMIEVRRSTRRIGAVASIVAKVGAAMSGGGGWAQALAGSLGGRAMWAPLALLALRALRRHRFAAFATTAGALALAGWWLGRRPSDAAPEEREGG